MGNQNQDLSSLTYKELAYKKTEKLKDRLSLLILTATNIETEILHQKMHPFTSIDDLIKVHKKSQIYYIGLFGVYGSVHVQCEMGAIGRGGSITTALEAIDVWEPKAVIMCGIAFGINKKSQNIGNVLVSDAIIPYNIQRVGKEETIHRNPIPQAGVILFNRFKSAIDWNHTLPCKQKAKIITGHILSGESLIDNIEYRDSLLKEFPNAKGGEMEGAGLYAAVDIKHLEWIVVKSICDYADGSKSKNKSQNQKIAAESAISLCSKVFSTPTGFEALGFVPINESIELGDNITIDHKRAISFIKTANKPENRNLVISYLVNEIPKRRDHTERYWIYIALGTIGGEKAKDAVEKGILEANEFARSGAMKARGLIKNGSQSKNLNKRRKLNE